MNLGYIILSANVEKLFCEPHRACWLGECLGKHIEAIHKIELPYGIQYRSEHAFGKIRIGLMTEYDKNKMPRTAVVIPTDGAY